MSHHHNKSDEMIKQHIAAVTRDYIVEPRLGTVFARGLALLPLHLFQLDNRNYFYFFFYPHRIYCGFKYRFFANILLQNYSMAINYFFANRLQNRERCKRSSAHLGQCQGMYLVWRAFFVGDLIQR